MLANLFRKASELGRLDAENARLTSALEKAEWKVTELEKEVRLERKAHNQALRRVADMMCRQAKLPEHFVADAEPKKPLTVEPPSALELERIEWAARELRQADIDAGVQNVPDLKTYIDIIAKDPNAVFG